MADRVSKAQQKVEQLERAREIARRELWDAQMADHQAFIEKVDREWPQTLAMIEKIRQQPGGGAKLQEIRGE